jgi:hypothetical protein
LQQGEPLALRDQVGPGDPAAVAAHSKAKRSSILLGGGTKRREQRDIRGAKARWADYKRRKRQS